MPLLVTTVTHGHNVMHGTLTWVSNAWINRGCSGESWATNRLYLHIHGLVESALKPSIPSCIASLTSFPGVVAFFPRDPSQSRALLSPLFPFSHLPDFEFCQTISHHRYLVYSAPCLKRYISSQEHCSTPFSHQTKLTHLTSGTFIVSERILGRQQQTFLSGTTIELERLRHTHRGCLAL